MERLNKEDDTLIHISHRHPLHLTDLPAGDDDDAPPPYCHACRFPCTGGSIYQCAPCRYVLHPSCARFSKAIRHPSHPEHDLALRLTPGGEYGCHLCRACLHIGYSWSFSCDPCGFDLHLPCAGLPGTAAVPEHAHGRHGLMMRLVHDDPRRGMGSFDFCAVCREGCSTARWFYACRECGVGAHVGCVVPDMPLGDAYAALDKAQAAVADAARWPEVPIPESQQLEELLDEQTTEFVRMEADAGGLLPLFDKSCQD
ncbi:hypothetical protein HU200_032979 [Digitaria exilis]|uniref:DC1 domain-containing protein n=1 Tax=Digitaria exilis TaxID=1010633 RepID=A0A835BT00_9POAL|nr:hypothetical protein HU200_032979 [Digitaria exilis]